MNVETVNDVAPATANESSLPADTTSQAAPATTEAAPEPSMDDTMQAIWDKHHPPRDETGKFQSKTTDAGSDEPPDEETVSEGQTQEAETIEQASKPAIDPPVSWPREMKEKFAALPPEVQEYVTKRESETHSTITRLGQTAKAAEPLLATIEQNKDLFSKRNVSAEAGVSYLLAAQRKLDENPYAGIAWLARNYGVDLAQFANGSDAASPQNPMVLGLQQEIESLRRELNETKGVVTSREQQEAQAALQQNAALVERFFADKGLTENDEQELAVLVSAERELNPGKKPDQLLNDAYETFMARTPERRQRMFESQRQAEEARRAEADRKKAADAKKLATLNVKSSPAGVSSAKTMDDTLNEIARKAYSR
jgi:hypothetical protein